MKEKMIATQDP